MKKAVIIGCGNIGEKTAAVLKHAEVALVGVCDLNLERVRKITKGTIVREYTEYERMLESEQPDMAFVSVPPYCASDILLTLAERGVCFMTSTPASLSLSEPDRISEIIYKSGLITGINNPYLSRKSVNVIEQFITANPVIHAEGYSYSMPEKKFWQRDDELSGGILLEKGMQLVELLFAVYGSAADVSSYSRRGFALGLADYFTDDLMCAEIKYAGGLRVRVTLGNFFDDGEGLDIYAFGKKLELRENEITVIGETYDPSKSKRLRRDGIELPDEVCDNKLIYTNEIGEAEQEFIQCVENNEQYPYDYEFGTRALREALRMREML